MNDQYFPARSFEDLSSSVSAVEKLCIVVPSESAAGLSAPLAEHFGLCPFFTFVSLEYGAVVSIESLPNTHHGCRDCMTPIKFLWNRHMDILAVRKLGKLPLHLLQDIGVSVLFCQKEKTVAQVVEACLKGKLREFTMDDTCSGECSN
ncbi:NifB/NifX family molybdenum-iron cluster-binding protein [Mailhella sp.]|uniref:NifB/NifX family molybdenum-iron cluster-binding protein n=1 Tax=Mailhella sp. TaxID=1981029 RepID=UPI004062DF7F